MVVRQLQILGEAPASPKAWAAPGSTPAGPVNTKGRHLYYSVLAKYSMHRFPKKRLLDESCLIFIDQIL